MVALDEKTDEEIAIQVQGGDAASFGLLMRRYEGKMSAYARRFLFGYDDAQDMVQEVFIKAYTNIQSFDPERKFSPWIYRIAHNEFVNAIKKRGRERVSYFDSDTLFPHPAYEETFERDADNAILKKMLDECLETLDPKYREPLVLFYYEELGYKEIAEIMQIPVSTVGIRIKRGKDALAKIWQERHPQYESH